MGKLLPNNCSGYISLAWDSTTPWIRSRLCFAAKASLHMPLSMDSEKIGVTTPIFLSCPITEAGEVRDSTSVAPSTDSEVPASTVAARDDVIYDVLKPMDNLRANGSEATLSTFYMRYLLARLCS